MPTNQDLQSVKYVAFLRGVNMLGSKVIKMQDLAQMFVSAGVSNVKTYLASGNVLFESPETNAERLADQVENALLEQLGYKVNVFLRTFLEVEEIVKNDPFKNRTSVDGAKKYVTFLSRELDSKPKLPIMSPKNDYEIIEIRNREAYTFVFPLGNGRFGNPVSYLENQLGLLTTTRNWSTVSKIAPAR